MPKELSFGKDLLFIKSDFGLGTGPVDSIMIWAIFLSLEFPG